jgi:ABC-2 type transport system ATP-binding protein
VAALFEVLRSRGVALETLTLAQPSLDDVFLAKTGRALRDAGEIPEDEEQAA